MGCVLFRTHLLGCTSVVVPSLGHSFQVFFAFVAAKSLFSGVLRLCRRKGVVFRCFTPLSQQSRCFQVFYALVAANINSTVHGMRVTLCVFWLQTQKAAIAGVRAARKALEVAVKDIGRTNAIVFEIKKIVEWKGFTNVRRNTLRGEKHSGFLRTSVPVGPPNLFIIFRNSPLTIPAECARA